MKKGIRNMIIVGLALVGSFLSLRGESRREKAVYICESDTIPVDSAGFLKKIFKDFPAVYIDTAYSCPGYVVVIRCMLMNHHFDRHRKTKKIESCDPAEFFRLTQKQSSMVKFK